MVSRAENEFNYHGFSSNMIPIEKLNNQYLITIQEEYMENDIL